MVADKSPYFVSWSGGKDCCLALCLMTELCGKPDYLLTMLTEDGERSRSHGLRKDVLQAQATALGVPIIFFSTSWHDYENTFLKALEVLKKKGINKGVFGDMKFSDDSKCMANRQWPDRLCQSMGMSCIEPLWDLSQHEMTRFFALYKIQAQFIAVKQNCLDQKYLGAFLTPDLIRNFNPQVIHPFGERGEYHTLVTDAVFFSHPLKIQIGAPVLKEGVWFLDVNMDQKRG